MAQDVLGFATSGTKSNPKAISSSKGTYKQIAAIQKNADPKLAGAIGQGADQSYKTFVAQKQQATQKPSSSSTPKNTSLFNKLVKGAKNTAVGTVKDTIHTGEKALNTVSAGGA